MLLSLKFAKTIAASLLCCFALVAASVADINQHTHTIRISPNHEQSLQAVIDLASPGSEIYLEKGLYSANLKIHHSISIIGTEGVLIDGKGQDDAIRIHAPNVVIEGLTIQNWGDDLTAMNAGIFVGKGADNSVIKNNRLKGDSTGIWIEKNQHVEVIGNQVEGNLSIRSTDRGNGIHLSNAQHANVTGNEVWHTRDGLYIINSQFNTLSNNHLHDLRYGVHYMYSHSNTVSHNTTHRTRAGYALMQSRLLTVNNNTAMDSEDYGILLNFITRSTLVDNTIRGVHSDPEAGIEGAQGKGFFIYNSLQNQILGNEVNNTDIGIHLTAGSEDNTISRNRFINNQTQVKYVATRKQEWSQNGVGNYWDNYLGWDLNKDQLGDQYFEPNDNVDKLFWRYPQARLLMDSPAIILLRLIQKQFPVLKSPGVRDSFPLMSPEFSNFSHQGAKP